MGFPDIQACTYIHAYIRVHTSIHNAVTQGKPVPSIAQLVLPT